MIITSAVADMALGQGVCQDGGSQLGAYFSSHRCSRDYSQQLRGCPWEGIGLGEQGPGHWQRGLLVASWWP